LAVSESAQLKSILVDDRLRMAGGVLLCAALALCARLTAPMAGLSAMLIVLVLGVLVRAALPELVRRLSSGISFSGKTILRAGVALLGLKVVLGDLVALGGPALAVVLCGVVATVAGGFFVARLWGEPRDVAAISATSVAICGASAALAASAIVPRRDGVERETVLIIVVVSLLSTAVMVAYPPLARALGFDGHTTGLLLGAAIHDVAQVAGAGFSVSNAVGVEAVAVKMIRVACLLPVIVCFGFVFARERLADSGDAGGAASLVPMFLVAFFALALLASSGFVPRQIVSFGGELAGWALTIAVAAIGLKTALGDLRRARPQLLGVLVCQTLLQLGVVVAMIFVLHV
jgi:uncharacterized integral membrane protein (TIGR00698 family)